MTACGASPAARHCLAFALILNANPLRAEAPTDHAAQQQRIQTFERRYFNPYNPQTARDIVDRIPGFTFDTGDELRGFGEAAGNVLVNGVRPTSKTGGIEDALTRIPANDVARVEVIRGAAGTSEATGQSVVANIVRVGLDRSARWKLELERNSDTLVYPRFEGALTARLSDWSTSTKLSAFWEEFPLEGRRDRLDANGELSVAQTENRPSELTQSFFSTEAIRGIGEGLLTINGRFGYSGFFPRTERLLFDGREPDATSDGYTLINVDSVELTAEASVDWSRAFANDWVFKAILLGSSRPLDETSTVRNERPVGTVTNRSRFDNRQTPIESIVRATMARGGAAALKPEVGLETAYNRLKSEFSLSNIDADGAESIVELPAANVLVEELRAEAFVNLIWAASPRWTLETGLAIEASRLAVSGDATNEQEFFFAKPSVNLLYRPSSSLQLRLGARRSVGQLDFGDFAASAEADVDRQFGGNPDLGPDQTWRAALAIDWRRESLGALNVELFHEWRNDVLEQIVLPSGAFGLANAGKGSIWGVEASAALQLTRAIPGGLLELRATVLDASYDDPLIRATRALTNLTSPILSVDFRQDLPNANMSWGISYQLEEQNDRFFINEIAQNFNGEELSLFVETTRWFGVKSRLALRGVGGRDFATQRTFFQPDRSGVVSGFEEVDRRRGMFITLTIEGQR